MVGFLQTVLSPLKMEVGTIFPRKPKPSTHSHPTHVHCPLSVLSQVKFKKIHEEALARMKAERAQQER